MHIRILLIECMHMQVNTSQLLPTLWHWWYTPKRQSQMGHKPFTYQMVDMVYLLFVITLAVHHQIVSRLGQTSHCSCALQPTVPSLEWIFCNMTSCIKSMWCCGCMGLSRPPKKGKTHAFVLLHTVEPLHSGHPWGTKCWPLYRGGVYWGVVLYTNCSFGTWVPGRYTEVAVKRGSTVMCNYTVKATQTR